MLFAVPYSDTQAGAVRAGVVLVEADTATESERRAANLFLHRHWVRVGDAVEVDVSYGPLEVVATR